MHDKGNRPETDASAEASLDRNLDYWGKRTVDTLGSLGLILITWPLMLLVALAIIVDSGHPVLFLQERLGRYGRVFKMIKFRTMRPGSDRNVPLNNDGSLRTNEADPRITRIGSILRRLSLDELPQLFNVLKGDMSLVGPRPDLPFHRQFYTSKEERKLSVRPGMTGLAQISGRNEIPWKERIAYDLEYVERQSLLLDLKILFLTVSQVLRSKGIYQSQAHISRNRSFPL